MSQKAIYGFPHVENPNDFIPDVECSSPQEIAAHKAACAAYGSPTYQPNRGCYSKYDAAGNLVKHVTRTSWGIGVNVYHACDGDDCGVPLDASRMTCHECARDFCPHCWPLHEARHNAEDGR